MTQLVLAGYTAVEDYFEKSDVFRVSKLTHTPFLVFLVSDSGVRVHLVTSTFELLQLPDDTPVMGQWRGEWRSDFFQFTVGQYRASAEKQSEPLKTATAVVKVIGPHGGLRYLSYQYVDKHGTEIHTSTTRKDEVARLEAIFA